MTRKHKPVDLARIKEQLDFLTASEATDMMLEFKAWVDAQPGYITDEMTDQAWADIWGRRRQRILDAART